MAEFKLSEVAAALGAPVLGNGDIVIRRAAEPRDAGPDALALAMDPKYADGLQDSYIDEVQEHDKFSTLV